MTINIPTLIAYTASILLLVSIILIVVGSVSERRRWFFVCSLPFFSGSIGCALLVNDQILPDRLALHVGTALLLGAYGFGWQAVRAFNGRSPVLVWAMGIPLLWLALSVWVFGPSKMALAGAISRTLVIALFNALCAWETSQSRAEDLPSRWMLHIIFVGFAAVSFMRAVFAAYLPMPLGALPTEAWSVVVYNLSAVIQVLLVSALLIALSRERIALRNQMLALRDPLTGALNRRAFKKEAQALRGPASHSSAIVTVIAFDLDHFKRINDTFGHDVGDLVIQTAVATARTVLRKTDLIFRMGGEEFLCVLPDTPGERGEWIADRLRRAFEKATKTQGGHAVQATMSVGVAASFAGYQDLPELVTAADRALYGAKRAGRNRVQCAWKPAPSGDMQRPAQA